MLDFVPDILPGFEQASIKLPSEDDGELCATLVRRRERKNASRPSVLYLHGYVDYFFQTWLADAFEDANYNFYALDLRRYGRSIRDGNRANVARRIDDYFTEIDTAIEFISQEDGRVASLLAHSTGGLVSSIYMSRGGHRDAVETLVLNSPFLRFNLDPWSRAKVKVVKSIGRFAPHVKLPDELAPAYGETIHKSLRGEWDYDLKFKPLKGFPLYPGWFHMISEAHQEVARGLNVVSPVLSMRSSASKLSGKKARPDDFKRDIVLNVDHIRELSPQIGERVTQSVIKDGLHDLTLSRPDVRVEAINQMLAFIKHHAP